MKKTKKENKNLPEPIPPAENKYGSLSLFFIVATDEKTGKDVMLQYVAHVRNITHHW